MLNCYPEQKMCDVAKSLKSLEEKSYGNTSQLASLYPPVGRDLGSGIFIFGRQYVHWSHWLCSKEALESLVMFKRVSTKSSLSSSREERASAFLVPNDWGEGGVETALFMGGYCNLRRTAEIFVSFTVLRPPWILLRFSRYITGFFYGDFLLTSYCEA
jgi:hypothetical protein